MPPTITDLHKILITCIHLNDNISSYPQNPSCYMLIVVHKLQDLSNSEEWKKSENPAKLSKGCKKGALKCKFVPKYSMLTCFFSKGHIKGQIKVSGVGGEGVHGSLSQPTAYKALLPQE